ncbi:MAG: alkaline phosphatase [Oligoflexia bacterium]|nr:alkaline phosphatase [Oligoflexia bacterium]
MNYSKNLFIVLIIISFLISYETSTSISTAIANEKEIKNVILLIPDGTGSSHITFSRWYNGGSPLAMDEIASGLIRTYTVDTLITDSAPAATAMATGYKSSAKTIGLLPSKNKNKSFLWGVPDIKAEDEERPVATVLEAARLAGKSVGLVATIFVEHATPAGFSAHVLQRDDFETIAKQQVHNGLDVALSGGLKFIRKEDRADKDDLIEVLKSRGYQVITNRNQLMQITSGKVWGAFTDAEMSNDLDRDKTIEPSLEEMTIKAISLLKKNKKGFFLMVEGSKVDWSSHKHDPVGIVTEFLAFDKAVKVALDFAKKRKDTAIIISPDHGNAGFSIGSTLTDNNYQFAPYDNYLSAIKKAKHTVDFVLNEVKKSNGDKDQIKKIIIENYIPDMTDEEFDKLIKSPKEKLLAELVSLIQKRNAISFTTWGHTGEDVPLFSYHPNPLKKLQGVILNTDIAKYIAKVLNLNLKKATEELYYSIDLTTSNIAKMDLTDTNNPILILKNTNANGKTLKLSINKNIAVLISANTNAQKEYQLPGVTIFNKEKNRVYFSKKCLEYL